MPEQRIRRDLDAALVLQSEGRRAVARLERAIRNHSHIKCQDDAPEDEEPSQNRDAFENNTSPLILGQEKSGMSHEKSRSYISADAESIT